jgi:trans-aconitate methyltransferase
VSAASPFDAIAAEYAASRPGYPDAAFDFVVGTACLPPEAVLLEVGVGTGQATVGLADRGFTVVGLEPGAAMVAEARRRLSAYPRVEIRESSFEDWDPQGRRFHMLVSAQAYHWIDPALGTNKPLEVLCPRGWVALMWNVPGRGRSRTCIPRSTKPIDGTRQPCCTAALAEQLRRQRA